MNEQPRGKPRGIKTKDTGKSARPKGRGIGPGEIQLYVHPFRDAKRLFTKATGQYYRNSLNVLSRHSEDVCPHR